jgi:hypothetical protein
MPKIFLFFSLPSMPTMLLMAFVMDKTIAKISVSLPRDLHQWLERHSQVSAGLKVPKSQIIAKALYDLRDKSKRK